MKKKLFPFLLAPLLFVLSACSDSEYKAEASMIEDMIYISQGDHTQKLSFLHDELTITDESNYTLEEKEYGEYELSTKDDTFYLKFEDGSELTFKRVGERLLEDEEGTIYQPS